MRYLRLPHSVSCTYLIIRFTFLTTRIESENRSSCGMSPHGHQNHVVHVILTAALLCSEVMEVDEVFTTPEEPKVHTPSPPPGPQAIFLQYAHWGLSLGTLYVANKTLASATASAGIKFPSALIGADPLPFRPTLCPIWIFLGD